MFTIAATRRHETDAPVWKAESSVSPRITRLGVTKSAGAFLPRTAAAVSAYRNALIELHCLFVFILEYRALIFKRFF